MKGLRKRIIGAILLLGLAIIIVPMLLNHPVNEHLGMSNLHQRPLVASISFSDEQSIGLAPTTSASTTDTLVEGAWLIQLASFSEQTNAQQLVKKLQQQYPAFLQSLTVDDKSIYRVLIGPFTKQQEAQQLIIDLQKQWQLKGHVIAYQPLMEST